LRHKRIKKGKEKMKIRIRDLDKELRFWVICQLENELDRDDERDPQQALLDILIQFERFGDAERYTQRNDKTGWRATRLMLERLAETEPE
jgi:hypothetical protein